MTEKEERKPVEEKRFAIFSRETIRIIADSVGISDITDQAASILREDVSYRLREATQNGIQYMKHGKRKKLTTEDLNKGLRKSDVQPVYGHRPVDSERVWTYQGTKDGQIMFLNEADISLVDVALDPTIPSDPGTVSVKAHWLAVEGINKSLQTNGSGKQPEKKLSSEQQTYYNRITNSILGNNEELLKVAIADLRTNPQILPLLPYFVSFISNGVKTISNDIHQLTRILHTLRALLNNKTLYLETQPYLGLLVQALQSCLLDPLTVISSPRDDHWMIRDYAARLLAQLLFTWSSPVNHLLYNTVKTLKEVLYNNDKPFYSHYGVVMAIQMLGVKTIQEVLIPHLPSYMPYLNQVIDDPVIQKTSNKPDAHKVYGAILQCVEFLLRHQIKEFEDEVRKEEDKQAVVSDSDEVQQSNTKNTLPDPLSKSVSQLYIDMYDYFGDSLTLPNLTESIDFRKQVFKPTPRDELVSLTDPEASKTGEELLDEFMEQVRVQEEIRKAQLEREKLDKIRIAREQEERRQERKRAEMEKKLKQKRKEEEERLKLLKRQKEQKLQEEDTMEINSSHSEEESNEPDYSLDSPSAFKTEPGIKLKITRGPNKNLHVKTVETMSPPQRNSPNPKHPMSPLYKHSPKSSSPLYKHSPKPHKTELSPHYKHSPKHSHSSKSKDSKDSKHSKKKKPVPKSKAYDEFEFESDPEDYKPLPFKKAHYYSSEGESSDGAGNRKPLTLKIKMKESRDYSPE